MEQRLLCGAGRRLVRRADRRGAEIGQIQEGGSKNVCVSRKMWLRSWLE